MYIYISSTIHTQFIPIKHFIGLSLKWVQRAKEEGGGEEENEQTKTNYEQAIRY